MGPTLPKSISVLLVEDDESIAQALRLGLLNEGWKVLTASNGEDGLALAHHQRFDVILLDVMLPDIDGFTLCRLLHHEVDAAIMMLTARGHEMDRVTGLELGADDYIIKPFGLGEVVARIRAILRRRNLNEVEAAGARLTAGDIELDRVTRQVVCRGKLIELSAREFNLLATLMEHAGQALSRQELLDRVWGEEWAGNSRTLDVHIRWLREKIEDDTATPRYIETVRGYGYRLSAPSVENH